MRNQPFQHNTWYQFIFASLMILLFLSILFVGCVPVSKNKPTPQNNDCPVEISDQYHSNYDFGTGQTKYVYVLIDKSYDYSSYIPNDFETITKSVVSKMQPGDRLVLQWLGLNRTTASIFSYNRIEQAEQPVFPPTPTRPPVTPTLTPGGPTTTQGLQIQTSEAINRDNELIRRDYLCEIGKWNTSSDEIYSQWQSKQQALVNNFQENVQHDIAKAQKYEPDQGKLIYENLSVVSKMLRSAMKKHQHDAYILIIFSDMNDWRPAPPDNTTINLDGIKVFVIDRTCQFAIDCSVENTWSPILKRYGAQEPYFLVAEDNIDKELSTYLNSIP